MIRAATIDDADAIVTLAEHFLSQTAYGALLPVTRERLVALVDPICTSGVIFVDDEGGALVGFLALVAGEHPYSGVAFAEELAWWVEPAYRGRRGLALLEAAEAWARGHALAFLKMVAPADSAIGALYRRRGYTAVEVAYQKPIARAA